MVDDMDADATGSDELSVAGPPVSPFATTNGDTDIVESAGDPEISNALVDNDPESDPDNDPESDPDNDPDNDPESDPDNDPAASTPPRGPGVPRRRSPYEMPEPLPRTGDPRRPAASNPIAKPARDQSRWRRGSIRTRTVGLAVVLMVVAGVVAGIAAAGVMAMFNSTQRSSELTEARRANDRSITDLEEIHRLIRDSETPADGDQAIEGRIRQLGEPLPLTESTRQDVGVQAQLGQVAAADMAYVATVRRVMAAAEAVAPSDSLLEAEQSAFAAAQRQRTQLDAVVGDVEASTAAGLVDTRNRSLIALAVALVVGAMLAVVFSFAIARSITRPMRMLAQVMRRFGDGDLHVRNVEAADEVGLLARSFNSMADGLAERVRELSGDAERVTQQRIISEALDLAGDEADIERIVEHSFSILASNTPAELLVAESGSSQLSQLVTNPTGGAPNCPVGLTGSCVAIRWGRTMSFDRPDALNACPMLRDRVSGPCSATCIPINVGGVVGVLHATGPVDHPPPPQLVEQLVTLASQTGSRIGSIRTLERTRLQASTDTLTGLSNRRTLESALQDLIRTTTPFVLVVADLDEFKNLNDRYGHEVGDRALQMFARVLSDNVRGHDIVARFGGEEFVLVYPEMDIGRSMEVIERMRFALIEAIAASDLPAFTSSFGVTHSSSASNVESVIRIADAGLMLAKELGRDRVVYSDAELAAEVFSPERSAARIQSSETQPAEPLPPEPPPTMDDSEF